MATFQTLGSKAGRTGWRIAAGARTRGNGRKQGQDAVRRAAWRAGRSLDGIGRKTKRLLFRGADCFSACFSPREGATDVPKLASAGSPSPSTSACPGMLESGRV